MARWQTCSIPVASVVLTSVVLVAGCGSTVASNSPTAGSTGAGSATASQAAESADPSSSPGGSPASPPPAGTEAIASVPATEGALNAIVIADRQIVVGGFVGPRFRPTILRFVDGAWSEAEVPDGIGQVAGLARLGDRFIAVGNALPDQRSGFIWESTDGRSWREVERLEDAALYDVVASKDVLVAAGARLDAEMNATASAWTSTDGRTWQGAAVTAAAGPSMASLAATRRGFAATGDRPLGQPRPFWTAPAAGASWTAVSNDLSDQLLPTDLVEWERGLAMVGASGRSGEQHPFVAFSADGARWRRTNLSTAEGYASAAAVADRRLIVAGVDADVLTVWMLTDSGRTASTYETSGASIAALAWDGDLGLIAVGARDGNHAVWALPAP